MITLKDLAGEYVVELHRTTEPRRRLTLLLSIWGTVEICYRVDTIDGLRSFYDLERALATYNGEMPMWDSDEQT